MEFKEKTHSSETVFVGKVFTVKHDIAELHTGKLASREVVEHTGGVCIAAVDGEKNVYLVDQFRYPFMRTITELPAGKLEKDEDPDLAAARELKEETGFTAKSLVRVAESYPSPGFCSETLYLYLATGLISGEQRLDEDEFLSCYKIPLATAVERVLSGEIFDGKTQTLLLLADKILNK